ncbi:MAG TPA: DUF5947 family protein [Solirubrobacteraceae bacterium]|nr:DUF5947 family protein [Solirubrobacteraceae bacterium]
MSTNGDHPDQPSRRLVADAVAARRRSELVTGLRGLASPTRRVNGSLGRPTAPAPGVENQGASVVGVTVGAAVEPGTEFCDLCGLGIPDEHRHLLHLVERRIVCSCEPCWAMRAGEGDYRPTGNRTLWLPDLNIPDDLWANFQIPIGLAFFMASTVTECVVAMYPSPAGATESELHFESWARMCELNPVLASMERDIEGLIANRLADPPIYAIAPIDQCYALTGAIKATWEGISGGAGVDRAVTRFFDALREKAAA